MNPSEAKLIAEFLLAEMAYESQVTTGVLASVPKERLNYRPDDKSKTALGLVRHITLEDEWLITGVADGKFPNPPDDSDSCGIMTPQDAVTEYNRRIPRALERVRALSGEQLLKELDMLGLIKMPALNFLSLGVKHSVHHRGQLSAYLRAMGGKVPMIYGPSADSAMA